MSIPVVQITSIKEVSEGMKVNRIYKGNAITQPLGMTTEQSKDEKQMRIQIVSNVLDMLTQ